VTDPEYSAAYFSGYDARAAFVLPSMNPWAETPELHKAWANGWSDADEHLRDDLRMRGYDGASVN